MHTSLTDIAGSDGSIFELLPDMFLLFDEDGTICDLRHPQPELMSGMARRRWTRRLPVWRCVSRVCSAPWPVG